MYAETGLWRKFLKFKRLVVREVVFPPNDICIELSTRCALGCGKCYRTPLSIPERLMPFETFGVVLKRLAEAAGPRGVDYLTFVGLGETSRHPRLADMLAAAKRRLAGVRVNLSTNLLEFDTDALCRIVREQLADRISVSIDDADGGDGDGFYLSFSPRLEKAMGRLCDLRSRHHPRMGIRIQSILISRPQVERVIDIAAAYRVDPVHFTRLDLHSFDVVPRPRLGLDEERTLLRIGRAYARRKGVGFWNHNSFDLFRRLASRSDRYCLLTDDHLFIDVDANVLPCYSRRAHALGNLRTRSLADIYAGDGKARAYLEQPDSCSGCDIYKERHHH